MTATATPVPQDLTPEVVDAFYAELLAGLPGPDADAWEGVYARWNAFKCRIAGEYSRREYKASQDARDEVAEEAARFMREQIAPRAEEADAKLREAFLKSPVRQALEAKLGKLLFTRFEVEQAAFNPANIPLHVEEGEATSRYQRLTGKAELEMNGETLTLSQANARLTSPDPAVRRAAWDAIGEWTLANRLELHEIYDELVRLRTRMGRNLGEENFVALGYRRMGRTDYGPAEVAVFREEIRRHVSPVLAKLRADQARKLGTPDVRPWDLAFFPGASLGEGAAPVGEQLARAQALFDKLDPKLAGHFRRMVEDGLIDLENRPGKRAGAFCTTYEDEGKVVIFCNSTGAASDVTTLLHEMGHAFQAWESRWIGPLELRWPTLDAAEVHSKGMEFLALKEIGAFFDEEDARLFRRLKLSNLVVMLPYMAVVDAFQHWVYEHPGHSHAEREAAWSRLWEVYVPGADWTGEEAQKATRWMRQNHIFTSPFYYIDYAIAEVGALQLWRWAEDDHAAALAGYLKLCGIGGTETLAGIFAAGGLKNPFEPGVLAPLMQAVEAELGI